MKLHPVPAFAALTFAGVTASCAPQAPASSTPSPAPSTVASATTPTFYHDVLPVLQENCQVCHTPQGLNLGGMVAPMAFVTYDETVKYAPRIARAVETGKMPPWHAAKDERGWFSNERVLADEDARTLIAWARGGTPAGDPKDAPPPKQFATAESGGWSIGKPDLIIKLPEPYLVADSVEDQYVHFKVPITEEQLPEDRWVKAVEFRAGSSAVHHIIADPLGGIAPGVGPTVNPDGYATVLRAGTTVTFQMHYHKTAGPGTAVWDQSSAAIIFYKPGEVIDHVVESDALGMFDFEIPAHDSDYSYKTSYTFKEDAKIVWMTPHMHLRGKAALYQITRPGEKTETLLSVPRYDFNWQHTYHFAKPVDAPAGTRVDLTLWWDNSEDNPSNPDPDITVHYGEPTTAEMGFGFMNFIADETQHYVVGDPIPKDISDSKVVNDSSN